MSVFHPIWGTFTPEERNFFTSPGKSDSPRPAPSSLFEKKSWSPRQTPSKGFPESTASRIFCMGSTLAAWLKLPTPGRTSASASFSRFPSLVSEVFAPSFFSAACMLKRLPAP